MNDERALSAVDTVHPAAGEVLVVHEGQVLVFAEHTDGRRVPVATVDAGGVLAGCGPNDRVRMLVVGVGGTRIRVTGVEGVDPQHLLQWVNTLGRTVAGGQWPARLLNVEDASSMVSPGEHIAADHDVVWVQVTGGSAMWCGNPGAEIAPHGPPLVLTPGTWITAGLRFRAVTAAAADSGQQWADTLDRMGRLALGAAAWRRLSADRAAVGRIAQRSHTSATAVGEAVDILTAAVGSRQAIPVLSDSERTEELAAAVIVAQSTGLPVTDEGVQRAAIDVEGGRQPVAAIAATCVARPNPVVLSGDWWQTEGNPMVVRVSAPGRSGKRSAAVVWRGGWEIVDPQTRQSTAVDAELAQRIDRRAIEMMRVLPARPLSLRSLPALALRGSRRELVIIVTLTAVLAGMAFITPYLLGQLPNVFLSENPDAAFAALFAALLLTVVAGTTFQAVRALSILRARSRVVAVSATAMWERVMRQRATWHSRYSLGNRLNQASAVNNASLAMPDEAVTQLLNVSFILGSLAAIATTNSTMLVALGALLLVQAAVTFLILRAAVGRAEQRFDTSSAASTMLMETLAAVNRLRVAGAESRAYLRWAQVQAPFVKADQALRRLTMMQGVMLAVWPLLTLVVVVAVTEVTGAGFGAFVTAQTAAAGATAAISAMAGSASAAVVARQSLRQAEPALESVPEGGQDGVSPGALSGSLEARDLVFRYGPDLPPVLDHVSISISPGEHVAVVGPSGCGKTTLMRVLLGLEDPDSGVIAVDGRDMASLDRPAVRRQIGSVLQSSSLLPCSIKDNVDMGRGLSQDEIWAALEAADLVRDVSVMAMGIETMVTDGGGTISGGQRQRVLIARALAGQPRMLVLDEATSALDNVTQAAVVESLARLRITRIVVAHRLSTIRDADRIIVMDAGKVVDTGTFDELQSRPGTFQELVSRQNL